MGSPDPPSQIWVKPKTIGSTFRLPRKIFSTQLEEICTNKIGVTLKENHDIFETINLECQPKQCQTGKNN